jgi:hypothetical protein
MTLNEAIKKFEDDLPDLRANMNGPHENRNLWMWEDIEAVETLLAFARKRRPPIVKALRCPRCWSASVASRLLCRVRPNESSATVYCRKCGHEVAGPWVRGDRMARNAARELWNAEPREVTCEPE